MAIFTRFLTYVQLCGLGLVALAQDVPLWVQGSLEGASKIDDTYNSLGHIVVNGFNVTVPKNLLVQFPAANVPWPDFVDDYESMLGYETLVIGNWVGGEPIAAQIQIYEFFEGLNQGFIESIDYEDGSMKIASGPTIRLSDPNAVFSVGYSEAPFWTVDDQNPSVSSFSGFPMCIPRNSTDPLCPLTQRSGGTGAFSPRDPLVAVPFQPGDFVTFSGIRRGNEYICFSVVAMNVQLLTQQTFSYLRMELGLLGIDNFNPLVELGESRFIGFASNRQVRTVALYAIDYDPCTGEESDRIISAITPRNNEQMKFEYRADILFGYARDYRAVAEINGVPVTRTTKNGFLAGTYVQPVNVWVHGEQEIPGNAPPAHDFSQMDWLTRGVGIDENGNLFGPLDPFPQSGLILDPPQCGTLRASDYKGDEVPDFVPSAQLLNSTTLANSTARANTAETAAPVKRSNPAFFRGYRRSTNPKN